MTNHRQAAGGGRAAVVAELRERAGGALSPAALREEKRFSLALPGIDDVCGGIPAGALTEVVVPPASAGSGLILEALVELARRESAYLALVDGSDSFDPETSGLERLEQLFWVRCSRPEQAVEAADILLRDSNFRFHVVNLSHHDPGRLRKMPGHVWYRFQRLAGQEGAVVVFFSAAASIPSARLRLSCPAGGGIERMDWPRERLAAGLRVDVLRDHRPAAPAKGGKDGLLGLAAS